MSGHPFDSRYPVDMMTGARDRIFVIAALIHRMEACADRRFSKTSGDEAATLIAEATGKIASLLEETHLAIELLRDEEDGNAA